MLDLSKKKCVAATIAFGFGACVASIPALAQEDYESSDVAYSIVTTSGGEVTNGAWEGYSGAYFAFNRDFSRDGWIGRIYGAAGRYDHEFNTDLDHVTVDGDYWNGDVMFGYLWVRGGLDFAVLLGGDFQERKSVWVSMDPLFSGRERDDEFGFKVAADLETNGEDDSPFYVSLGGSYSTAFDTYYALGRVGYNFDRFTIGPEAWALGDDSGDAQRLGGFLKLNYELGTVASAITVSGGYQFTDDGFAGEFGAEGGYATLELSLALGEPRGPLK